MRPESLGRYELIRHLASGGMAQVYLARANGLGGFARHVVVKAMSAQRQDDEAYVRMFLDEARLAAMLHHQHIAQVYEVGCGDDGTYFLVMEYVHGVTVRAVLEAAHNRGAKLPLELGVSVAIASAAGLHHAHECCDLDGRPLGIVHRDVSPSNVLLGHDGSIKLIDFGIAKANQRTTHTATGCIKGKTGYMAPEQARGYAVDRRTDVFALGVLAYELTTQSRAFHAPSQFETMQRTLRGEVKPPSQVVPGYPRELEDVIMTALEVDPDERFQDAEAMRSALDHVARELALPTGAATVIHALDGLFERRSEPWMGPTVEEPTPIVNSDPSIVIVPAPPVRIPPTPPARVALGTVRIDLGHAAHESIDLTTRPFERALPPPPASDTLSFRRPTMPPLPAPPLTPVPSLEDPVIIDDVTPLPLPLAPRSSGPFPAQRIGSAMLARASSPLLASPPPFSVYVTRQREAQKAPRRFVKVAIASTVLLLGFAGGALVLKETCGDTAPTPEITAAAAPVPMVAPAPVVAPAAAPTPAPVVAKADTIQLAVTTRPAGATVVLDGVRLGTTPYTATVPSKAAQGWLKVRMHGRVAVKTRVPLDRDVRWDVQLQPVAR
jgi:serine/threonine-protein kinase